MSTLIPASASGANTPRAMPGRSGTASEGHLGDVAVVGQAADLVALLHERILPDQRTRRVLERAQDLDLDAVDPAQLDGADLHDLGALLRQLEHLLVADDGQLARGGHEARIGGVDAAHVGEDLAAIGAQRGREGDGGRVRAATPEGRRLAGPRRRPSVEPWRWPWNPATITTLPLSSSRADPPRLHVRDPRPAVRLVRGDPGLRAGQRDRPDAERVERHRDERRALVLAGGQEHVELARVGVVGDRRGEREQLVRRVAHRRDDDHEVRAGRAGARDPLRDPPDPIGLAERRAAELLDDELAGHGAGSLPAAFRAPAAVRDVARSTLSMRAVTRTAGAATARTPRRVTMPRMCTDHDSRPPIEPISGAAIDARHGDHRGRRRRRRSGPSSRGRSSPRERES